MFAGISRKASAQVFLRGLQEFWGTPPVFPACSELRPGDRGREAASGQRETVSADLWLCWDCSGLLGPGLADLALGSGHGKSGYSLARSPGTGKASGLGQNPACAVWGCSALPVEGG